ncbi:hypothetical protein [Spirosoma foliorum]|uniref:Uncharacterized protein n=1 Tax=Spirosoma foliorum TaxID=2710596 RepID=A0A7G5H5G1_9BACT|nr:hypothetical protein [Spirosoma foliorum]QMW06353.1 hypothetical protein H3H32_16415 [Spirosoma foliorum]
MADAPLFLRVRDRLRKKFVFTPWPMNALGRPVMAFMANVLFRENPNPEIFDAIPDGAVGQTTFETEGWQGVTNQGNVTADWVEAAGYAMDSSPAPVAPTGLVALSQISVADYNRGQVIKKLLGEMTWAEIAVQLKPYFNSTTPGTGPTVLNPIPDQTVTIAGDSAFAFAANTFSGTDNSYTATKSDGSTLPFSFNSSTRSFIWWGTVPNGTYRIKVTGANGAGSASTEFNVTIDRVQVPYIISILRKYDPVIRTFYYLVKHSFTGNDDTKQPVARGKLANETAWRTGGQLFYPIYENTLFPDDLANGYQYYYYANMYNGTPTTNTVVQFKPYYDAPDSAIIQLEYTLPTTQDYGTEVYHYTPGTKITEAYTGRIAGTEKYLSCYANGTGTIKTVLVATGSTPPYANGEKVMTTADGPYDNASLFTGTKPYGSLYRDVVNGTYTLSFVDDNGNSLAYPITVTDSGPISVLKAPTGSGGGGGDSDLTTAYAFTGTPTGGHRSTDPTVLSMAYDFSGGRLRNIRNTVTKSFSSGYAARYVINNRWYAYNAGNWYRVLPDKSLSSTPTILTASPELGLLVQYYEVELSRAISYWRDNPVTNASQLVRSL